MTVASGTRRGSADRQNAIDSRPDVNLAGIQQRPEDGGGEIAAVAPEGGLHTAPVGGNESGDDQGAREIRGHELLQLRARLGPLDARTQGSPLDDDGFAGVNPLKRPLAP